MLGPRRFVFFQGVLALSTGPCHYGQSILPCFRHGSAPCPGATGSTPAMAQSELLGGCRHCAGEQPGGMQREEEDQGG